MQRGETGAPLEVVMEMWNGHRCFSRIRRFACFDGASGESRFDASERHVQGFLSDTHLRVQPTVSLPEIGCSQCSRRRWENFPSHPTSSHKANDGPPPAGDINTRPLITAPCLQRRDTIVSVERFDSIRFILWPQTKEAQHVPVRPVSCPLSSFRHIHHTGGPGQSSYLHRS